MRFQQNILDVTMSYSNREVSSKINCFGGEQYENNGRIRIHTYRKALPEALAFCIDDLNHLDMDSFSRTLDGFQNEMVRNGIHFQAYLKIHNEYVKINHTIEDQRYYGYLRLYFKDQYQDHYIDEIPVINYDLKKAEAEACSAMGNIKQTIQGKKSFIGFKKWREIPVILSSCAAGYFIHEVLGHVLEEDVYPYGQAFLKDASFSHKLTVKDAVLGYENYIGLSNYDDNGIRLKPVTLVKNGSIQNRITICKDSAKELLYGMARREDFTKEVLPRMRNTFIEPYDNLNQEDIIMKYKTAVLVDRIYSGSSLYSTGEYIILGSGFYFENGEKQYSISNLMIRADILKHLRNIDYIGNDLKIIPGECSKLGNIIRVCMGGPTISFACALVEGGVYLVR